ncbi:hypothetical protein FRC08_008004, partial [Ceratobasidium sp. 394]
MLSTKVLTLFAFLAVSASGLSVGHPSNQLAHRHAARAVRSSVLGARTARRPEGAEAGVIAKRDGLPAVRRRGLKARRCAVKSSSALPSSTPIPDASSASAEAPTSSADPAPEPTTSSVKTTSEEPTKTQAPTSKPATKTSTSVEPTKTDDGPSSGGDVHTGEATFYGTGLGACGITNKDSDFIAAASQL